MSIVKSLVDRVFPKVGTAITKEEVNALVDAKIDSKLEGAGGGGGGTFVVNVYASSGSGETLTVYSGFTIDKTAEEIKAAYAAGMPIVVKFSSGGGSFLLHLFRADDGYYYFHGIQNTYDYMGGKFKGSVKLFSMAIIQSSGTVERAESETIYTRS